MREAQSSTLANVGTSKFFSHGEMRTSLIVHRWNTNN